MLKFIVYCNFILVFMCFAAVYSATFSINADGDAHIQEDKGVLTIHNNIVINYMNNIIKTNSLVVNFYNLDNISANLKKQSFVNFKTIESKDPFVLYTSSKGILKGNRYFFDVAKNIMIVTSKAKYITYEDERLVMYAKQRLEYLVDKHLGVLRGNPRIFMKNSKSNLYANLITAQMDKENKNLLYMEAFDKVSIVLANQNKVKGQYAYYDAKKQTVTVEDHVSLSSSTSGTITACRIVIDILTGDSEVIPCKNQDNFNTQIKLE